MAEIGNQIQDAVKHLVRGDIIGIPTETVYGLAANALDEAAVLKIFKVKNRPTFDPLIVHCDSIDKISQVVENFPDPALKLAKKFWPGPLTLILPKKEIIPDLVTSGMNTVAVRVPNHPLTLSLLEQLDFPLAAPSANPFGYISPTNPRHVNDQLGHQIPFILDGGDSEIGIESTIVDMSREAPGILRLGGISREKIEEAIGQVQLLDSPGPIPEAPGMLESHYAPTKPLYFGEVEKQMKRFQGKRIGILSLDKFYSDIHPNNQIRLSKNGNLDEAAKNLFSAMRNLDKMNIDLIIAEKFPERSVGRAINDRLMRASLKRPHTKED